MNMVMMYTIIYIMLYTILYTMKGFFSLLFYWKEGWLKIWASFVILCSRYLISIGRRGDKRFELVMWFSAPGIQFLLTVWTTSTHWLINNNRRYYFWFEKTVRTTSPHQVIHYDSRHNFCQKHNTAYRWGKVVYCCDLWVGMIKARP